MQVSQEPQAPIPQEEPQIRRPEPFIPLENEEREKVATPEQEIAAEGELLTELSDEERLWFETLLTVGRRSKTITVMGHPVVITTLTTADEMRIGLFTKPYLDTQLGFQRAYQVAVCAAGIRELQGRPLFTSLSQVTSEDEVFDRNVEAVQKLYPIVVTQVYQAIIDLEREFAELAVKLGKLSG